MSLLVIATGILYANLDIGIAKLKKVNILVASVLLILFAINYVISYKEIHYLSDEFAKREVYLSEQKEDGNKYIVFDNPILMPSKYGFEDLSENSSYWLNVGYAKYFGVDSVKVVPAERIYKKE